MASNKKINKEFDRFIKDFDKSIEYFNSRSWMVRIGVIIRDMVKERMQSGFGVKKDGGYRRKFKELAASTVAKRKRNKKLASNTTPTTSNQIETGKMYNSINYKIKSNDEIFVGLAASNERVKVAEYQEKKGRSTFYLSGPEIKRIHYEMNQLIEKTIKKVFKKYF